MSGGAYAQLLRQRGIPSLLLVGMIARLPHSAAGMLLLLHLVNTMGKDWGSAGLVVALMTVGIALGAPWRGHQVDRHGLRRALIPSIAIELIVWLLVPHVGFTLLMPLVFIGGLFSLPVFSVIRTSLGVMTSGGNRRSAFALDAISTELVFIIGPAAAGIVATQLNTTVGMTAIAIAASGSGLLLFWLNPPTRSDQLGAARVSDADAEAAGAETAMIASAPAHLALAEGELLAAGRKSTQARIARRGRSFKHRFGWVSAGVIAVFIAASGAGLVLSGSEVGIVALLDEHGNSGQLGIVFFFWCFSSLIGGLIYGSLKRSISPIVLLLAMSVFTIPMMFATDTWTLAVLSIFSGLLCAPVLSAASERLAELVPEKRRGEAMGWYGSALTGGTAMGSPLTGMTIDALGPGAGFLGIGILGAAICLLALMVQRLRRRRARALVAAA